MNDLAEYRQLARGFVHATNTDDEDHFAAAIDEFPVTNENWQAIADIWRELIQETEAKSRFPSPHRRFAIMASEETLKYCDLTKARLVTAPDEQQRCCVLDDDGNRCPNRTQFWVGTNGVDDYTHVCEAHLEDVRQPRDAVHPMKSEAPIAP